MKNISLFDVSFFVSDKYYPDFWDMVNDKKWEAETFEVLKKNLFSGAIFLDIGCWEGVFSLYAAQMGANSYAIDADKVALGYFQEHLTLNPTLASRIAIHHVALAAQNGTIKLYARHHFGDSASSILDRVRDVNEFTEVKSQFFGDFCAENEIRHIDLIKMDIEGSEFFILEKMVPTLEKCHFPTLYIAFHPQYLVENYLKKYIKSRFLGRVILKLAKTFRISFFKPKIQMQYLAIFQPLMQHYEMHDKEGKVLDWQLWIESGTCLIPDNILLVRKRKNESHDG